MNFKRLLTTVLPILLVLSMLLTSCMNTDKSSGETDTHSHVTEDNTTKAPETTAGGNVNNEPEPTPPTEVVCQHTETTLKNQRDATCLLEGYTGDRVCLACGATVSTGTLTAKTDHTWNEGRVTKLATCIETGVKTISCTVCGTTKTETLSTVAHDEKYHAGNDTHTLTCSVCLTSGEPEEHTPVDEGVYYPATCLEGAYTIHTCSLCKFQYKVYSTDESELATGHSWDPEDTDRIVYEKYPTCSEAGSLHMLCQHCGAESPSVTIPATGEHTFNYDEYVEYDEPTCTESGKYVYKCEDCDATEEKTVASLGHNYEVVETTDDGWTYQRCSCGDEISHFNAANKKEASVTTENIATDKAFEVKLETADIQFPKEVVEQIKNAGENVTIKADVVDDTTKEDLVTKAEQALSNNVTTDLKQEDVEALKDPSTQIYDFGVLVGTEPGVSGFNQKVTVTLPYTLKTIDEESGEKEDPDGIVIWYVSDDGTVQKIDSVVFRDPDGDGVGTVSFEAEHFSCYAVAYRETPEMRCRRGSHNYDYDHPVESVEATCSITGYDIYECTICHNKIVGNIKAPSGHSWSTEVFTDAADCTNSGRTYKKCLNDGCEETFKLSEIAPAGHKITSAATCESAAVCTVCGKVAVPAKGHQWTKWEDVVQPTEINSGLRRRYCLTCGEMEEVRLAATGNIKEWEFESYQEVLETIFEEVLNFGNGTVSFEFELNGKKTTVNMTVNEEGDSYLILIDIEVPNSYGSFDKSQFVYRNGVMISKSDEYYGMDLNAVMTLPLETLLQYTEQVFDDCINPYAEEGLKGLRALLDEYSQLYGAQIDTVLEAAGSTYRVAELAEVLDSFETVYAYLALKMGFETNLMVHEGVEVPTKSDWHNVFGALTEATESDGNKTYTLTLEPLMDSIDATLTWFEDNSEKKMGEMLYLLITNLYGEGFTETYEKLTDWESTYDYFTEKYNGDVLVSELIDDVISMVEESGIVTMQDVYALVDELMMTYVTGGEFDSEAYVQQYSKLTLDEVVQEIMGNEKATVADLYNMLKGMLNSTYFGDIVLASSSEGSEPESGSNSNNGSSGSSSGSLSGGIVGPLDGNVNGSLNQDSDEMVSTSLIGEELNGETENEENEGSNGEIEEEENEGSNGETDNEENEGSQDENSNVLTIDSAVAKIRKALAGIKPQLTFEVTLDENGNLIALKLDQDFAFVSGSQEMPVDSLLLEIKQDDNAKVELPEELRNATEDKLTYSYDTNGNLVISGLNANVDYDFSINGYGSIDLTKHLTKDEAMSKKLGYDVYVLDQEYWYEIELISNSEYLIHDGKFYEATSNYESSYSTVAALTKLSDVKDPEIYLPDTSKTTHEYYRYRDSNGKVTLLPVYQTVLGMPAYQLDGEWYLFTYNGWSSNDEVDPETGMTYTRRIYSGGNSALLSTAVESLSLSTLSSAVSVIDPATGKALENVHTATFYMDGFSSTVNLKVQLNGDDIYLIQTEYVDSRTVLTVGSEATNMPAYDYYDEEYWSSAVVQLANGTVTADYVPVDLYVKVPTYYVEYDGCYFALSGSAFVSATANIEKTVTLDDGREFYVVEQTAFGAYDTVLVGYFKTQTGYYVQAACLYSMDELQDIVYRYGDKQYDSVSLYGMYNLDQYVTKNSDGTYTVKAELFTKLEELCVQPDDLYALCIYGSYKIGKLDYDVEYWLDGQFAQMNVISYLMSTLEAKSFTWYDWFGYGSSDDIANQFDMTVNDDGTISIFVDEDQVAYYNVYFRDKEFASNLDADDVMVYDEEQSAKYGVPVYSVTNYSYTTNFYFKINGEYYTLEYDTDYLSTVREVSFEGLFADWSVSNLSLNYYTLDGNEPVYRGNVVWENQSSYYPFSYSLNNRFFQIVDGTLYILTEAVEMGDSTIKYEGRVKASEYFKESLHYVLPTDENSYSHTDFYLPDGETEICYVRVTIKEGDTEIGFANVPFYLKNGERQYLVIENIASRHTVTGKTKVTVPETWQEIGQVPFTTTEGTYVRVCGSYLSSYTGYYVKIADHYYNLDSYNPIDEQTFVNKVGERVTYYVVENADGSFTVYSTFGITTDANGNDVYVMQNEVGTYKTEEEFNDFLGNAQIEPKYFGLTVDDLEMYEFSIISTAGLTEKKLDDNTVFYYNKSTGNGYVKLATDKYVSARLVAMGDGSEEVLCSFTSAYQPSGADLLYRQGLLDSIQCKKNEMILSPKLLELLQDYGDEVYIEIRGYYLDEDLGEDKWHSSSDWHGTIDLDDLSAWFEVANQKNDSEN